MGIGRRLYDLVRAQVGHYARHARLRRHAEDEESIGEDGTPGASQSASRERRRREDDEVGAAYRLLELPYGSGPEAVRSAHRSLLRRFHPDRFARDEDGLEDATRLSQKLTAARDLVLSALESGAIRPRKH